MQVTVIDTKTGAEKSMAPRFAQILAKMGRVQYLTRDMTAAQPAPAMPDDPKPDAPPEVSADSLIVPAGEKPARKNARKPKTNQ